MTAIQLQLFTDLQDCINQQKEDQQKAKKKPKSEELNCCFLVNSSHIQVWRDCDIKTAQRRLRRIKKHYGIQNGRWLTFKQVADYEGWNAQQLLQEIATRRLRLKEKHREK